MKESDTLTCLLCGELCAGEVALQNHLQSVHNVTDYTCAFCNDTFAGLSKIRQHEKNMHSDGLPWTFECPECGIRKEDLPSMQSHRARHHGLNKVWQRVTPAMRWTPPPILRMHGPDDIEHVHGGKILPYVEHKRCPLCGECQRKDHTWAWHVAVSCVLNSRHITVLGTAFKRDDFYGLESCHCAEKPGSQIDLPCNSFIRKLLDDDEYATGLRVDNEVASFYHAFGAEAESAVMVYLLFRAKPNTRLSKEELARRVFYVGQSGDWRGRTHFYSMALLQPKHKMSKAQERLRYEHETAMRNGESVIMLRVRVDVGDKTVRLFRRNVLESSLMLFLGMDRLSNIEVSLVKGEGGLSDEDKDLLIHARTAAAAAFEATSQIVDGDWGKASSATWLDCSKAFIKNGVTFGWSSSAPVDNSTSCNVEIDQSSSSSFNSHATTSFVDGSDVSTTLSSNSVTVNCTRKHVDEITDNIALEKKPRKQNRLYVKTSGVWEYFNLLPLPVHAAACDICHRTIKITGSSTTSMMRHLRSYHNEEYQQLQVSRRSNQQDKTLENVPGEAMQDHMRRDNEQSHGAALATQDSQQAAVVDGVPSQDVLKPATPTNQNVVSDNAVARESSVPAPQNALKRTASSLSDGHSELSSPVASRNPSSPKQPEIQSVLERCADDKSDSAKGETLDSLFRSTHAAQHISHRFAFSLDFASLGQCSDTQLHKEDDPSLHNASISHATARFSDGSAASSSLTEQWSACSPSSVVPSIQLPDNLKIVLQRPEDVYVVVSGSTSSAYSAPSTKRRRLWSEVSEVPSTLSSKSTSAAGSGEFLGEISDKTFSLPTTSGTSAADSAPSADNCALNEPVPREGRPVTYQVKSFQYLVQKLGCTAEDAIRLGCAANCSVATDGITASYLPVFSPPVKTRNPATESYSTESVEVWPHPYGFVGSFAQSQRKHG